MTIVGDVHGQFWDVLEMFRIAGPAPDVNYLFLGDYVDRGHYSVETITLLVLLKVRWPSRITLIRGNHESRSINQVYGFHTECTAKYGSPAVWSYFVDLFDYLTVAALIDDSVFCVHGGLSPSLHTLDQIRVLDRFMETPHEGPLADLLWSDPDGTRLGFNISQRGAGYQFGKEVFDKFMSLNGLVHFCRAHQLCQNGFSVLFNDRLSTVWSAPNYCYRCGNVASVLELGPGASRFYNTYDAAPDSERTVPPPPADGKGGATDYFM